MSITNNGISYAASVAGTQMAEKQAQTDKNTQSVQSHQRKADSLELAAKAEGLGGTEEESASSEDRDADGRQAWARIREDSREEESNNDKSLDASGKIGKTLDLSG